MNKIEQRVEALRRIMAREKLDAWYILGTDPHMSEYLPERWRTREFITGFSGSYGEVVITLSEAFLWTDTRYFLQAETQLEGTGIKMQKLRVPGAVPPSEWLAQNLNPGAKVGVDPVCLPVGSCHQFRESFHKKGIQLVFTTDFLDEIWEGRPSIPENEIFELDVKYAGFSRAQKFEIINNKLKEAGADLQIITSLDDLAWTFNLRRNDVAYNPVFVGYGIVGKDFKLLFTKKGKIPESLYTKLCDEGIIVKDYDDFFGFLKTLNGKRIYLDPEATNTAVLNSLPANNETVDGVSIPAKLKACKNETELEGFRTAMRKDGAALVNFLFWLKQNIGEKTITEFTVGRKLAAFRAEQEGFRGESFTPIVGYKSHGAIVHLSVNEENANTIHPLGFLLFDSGGHYFEGTTDITRTIALGPLSEKQRRDFTLVLKGMIALTEARFPYGTKGVHLDLLARKALWENGLNYGHGTGHGVGHYLAVHEGPMAIRQEYNPNLIELGMVLSNEPGLYREGEYGVRTENMMVCVEKEETEFGRFLGFETLSLCPVDVNAIDQGLLTEAEKRWINDYHARVKKELAPLLSPELIRFLEEITPEVR